MSPKKRQRIEIIADSAPLRDVKPMSKRKERELVQTVQQLRAVDPDAYAIFLDCARKLAELRARRMAERSTTNRVEQAGAR